MTRKAPIWGDFVADDANASTEDKAESFLLREEIDSMLQGLNPREREVIILRFWSGDRASPDPGGSGETVQRDQGAHSAN